MTRRLFQLSSSALAFSLVSLCAAQRATPPTSSPLQRSAVESRLEVTRAPSSCLVPFESHGTYRIGANYSGAGASSDLVPAGKVLDIHRVKITLAEPVLRAGNLGVVSGGVFAWYDLRVDNAAVVFSSYRDGALYADGGTAVKFVAYRNGDSSRAVHGTYVISGCLLDHAPRRISVPDATVPRLPKKRLTPLEPVELKNLSPLHPSLPLR